MVYPWGMQGQSQEFARRFFRSDLNCFDEVMEAREVGRVFQSLEV